MNFQVEWFDKLASTNATLRERFYQNPNLKSGMLIAAREQTAGRGRQDRKWLSAPDQNLCFSLYVQTDAELSSVPSLTMAAALAVTEMLKTKRISAAPKWPNDILIDGKKICGILSERVEQSNPPRTGILIGMGLNVNMTSEEAAQIDRPATSILIETHRATELQKALEDLFPHLEYWIDEWRQGGFQKLQQPWTEQAGPIGKALSVHDGRIKKSGTLSGFGPHGELLLKTEAGIETIWSGDVSP